MLLKRFFSDAFFYGFSGLVSRVLSFLLVPFYTRVFSPADYGLLDLVTIFTHLLINLVALNITAGVARFYAEAETDAQKQLYASTALGFVLAAYGLFVCVGLLFDRSLCLLLFRSLQQLPLYYLLLLNTCCVGLAFLFQNQTKWEGKVKTYALSANLNTLLTLGLSCLFVLGLGWHVTGAVVAQIIGVSIAGIVAWYSVRGSFTLAFEAGKLKQMLSYCTPLVFSSIGLMISLNIDRLMIRELLSVADMGIYGIGLRFASVTALVTGGISQAVPPLIFAHYKEADTPRQLAQIFTLLAVAALSLMGMVVLFAREVVMLMTPAEFYPAYVLVPPLVMSAVVSQLYIFYPGLNLAKRSKLISILHVSGGLLNIALNWIMILTLGLMGSALATVLSTGLTVVVYARCAQPHYPVDYPWTRVLLTAGLVLAGSYALDYGFSSWLPLVAAFGAKLVCAPLLVWLVLRAWLPADKWSWRYWRAWLRQGHA